MHAGTRHLPGGITGEPLNDAAYSRKINTEETYNCIVTQVAGNTEPMTDVKKIQKSVQAGDHMYDIAMIRGGHFTNLLTNNYLIELTELQNIDFEHSWWRKKASDALLVGGKRYGVSGNMSSLEISLASLVCFNKKVLQDNGLESPYELVKSGDWTFDKLIEMGRQAARDLNGDGEMKPKDDFWGITYDRDRIWNLLNGCEIKMIELSPGGLPRITVDSGENPYKIQSIFTRLFDGAYNLDAKPYYSFGMFRQQRSLFDLAWANNVVELRAFELDFGVVPIPKYNMDQKEYISNVYGIGLPIICVPSTNADAENTGLFMEVFSYEGQKSIIPIFYENILKTKSARDSEMDEIAAGRQ